MRPNRSLARGYLATVAFAFAAAVACSGRDHAEGAGGESFKPPVEGAPCEPGQIRDCGIELGRNGSVVDCAKGTQTCNAEKAWGACEANGTTFKAAAPAPKAGAPGLGTNAVGGSSTTCVDNPCNPDCKTFNDSPDSGLTSDAVVTTTVGGSVLLENSNVPGGFQKKGTLDGQCASAAGSQSNNEACQFDMHCGIKKDGTNGCVPFVTNEKNACTGVDITAPPVCVPSDTSTWRNLTICNRGSVDLTQNIQCMGYPGNSPQFPDDNPGAGRVVLQTGTTVDPTTGTTNPITAAKPIKPGECRTFRVPNSNFQSNGTESIMCNPPSTATPVTTTLRTLATSAETVDFATKDNALNDADSNASATTTFAYANGATAYATGTANNVGFSSPTNMTAAPNSVGAPTALATTTSSYVLPTSAANASGGWWSPSTASTLLADVQSVDTKSASVAINKNDTAWMLTKGYTIPGASGSIIKLDIAIDATYGTVASDMSGYIYLRKADGTFLGNAYIRSGVASFTLPYGMLTATELPNLEVWVAAVGFGWSGGSSYTMTLNRVNLAGTYYNPSYATIDATGYTWTAPPAGNYSAMNISATWKSSAASGAVLYAYVKRVSDNSVVASALFQPPTGYTVGTWMTTATNAATVGLTTADLTGGLYVSLEGHPVDGGSLELDSLALKPIYYPDPTTRTIRFKGFSIAVPPGATNVKLAALANYKVDPWQSGDWISGTVLSISGSTTTLISTSSATIPNNAFNVYQLGYSSITDTTAIEDPKLTVDVTVGKGAGAPSTLSSVGSLESLAVRLQYDATVGGSVAECNPSNNWTVNKANPSTLCDPVTTTTYPPWTMTRVFQATCPSGFKPKWKYAGYTSTTPAGTKIEFRFRAFDGTVTSTGTTTCGALAAVTASPPVPLATAQLSPNTQVCSLAATPTATCPVNLSTGLPTTDVRKECLQLDAYGIPAATPPASPTLTDWRVTYDCIAEE